MNIVRDAKAKKITFGDLEEGETFTEKGESQIKIKTDNDEGCCLEDGGMYEMDDDEEVIKVNCEVRVLK